MVPGKQRQSVLQNISLRPILYIGLGGFGCAVVRKMKAKIQEVCPQHMKGFGFLGMDTQVRKTSDNLSVNEYLELSRGVNPRRVAREKPEQLSWFLDVIGSFKTKSITAGADRVRAIGRLAFRYPATFNKYITMLSAVTGKLTQPIPGFTPGQTPKVYVICTLAGGTGSGCFLDVMNVTGKFVQEQIGGDFPYQAVLATPDHLEGEAPPVHFPQFKANTYSALKELHNFLVHDDTPIIDYDNAQWRGTLLERENLPTAIHLICDTNERGIKIVNSGDQMQGIVVNYLLSEVATPLQDTDGTPRVQDLENHDEQAGHSGMPRAFSSFGVVTAGVPLDLIERYFAYKLIFASLERELLEEKELLERVSRWVDVMSLREKGSDQFQDSLLKRTSKDVREVSLDVQGQLLTKGFEYARLGTDCRAFAKDIEAQHKNKAKNAIQKAAAALSDELTSKFAEKVKELVKDSGVGDTVAFLKQLQESLGVHEQSLTEELAAAEGEGARLSEDIKGAIRDVEASARGWLGRRRRVEATISEFGTLEEANLRKLSEIWVKTECGNIYSTLLENCKKELGKWQKVADALVANRLNLGGIVEQVKLDIDGMADISMRGPGNRFSIINSDNAEQLYQELIGTELAAVSERVRAAWKKTDVLAKPQDNFDNWLEEAYPAAISSGIEDHLRDLDFLTIMNRFYPKERNVKNLFQNLAYLSLPLFHLNEERIEDAYEKYWIVGIDPSQRATFEGQYSGHLEGQGVCYAQSSNPHEVQFYQFKLGFTIHSHKGIMSYEPFYRRLLEIDLKAKAERKSNAPVHAWPDAENWDELMPDNESRAAGTWFILGRAFNYLFPTDGVEPQSRKNTAFIFARGANYYYRKSAGGDDLKIGQGLPEAIRNFTERLDWQESIKQAIIKKRAQVGVDVIRDRLQSEYIEILNDEIDKATNDSKRLAILKKLRKALETYMKQELSTVAV